MTKKSCTTVYKYLDSIWWLFHHRNANRYQ